MADVFVNFRNGDGEYAADTLHRELSRGLGSERVFRSSRSITPGDDYIATLLAEAARCHVLLAVIGSNWLSISNALGHRRIDEEDDWVRREIATAFRARRRVIPILLDNTPPPTVADLPDDITPLASCQYRRMTHRDTMTTVLRLETELRDLIPGLGPNARRHNTNAQAPDTRTSNIAMHGGIINHANNGDVNIEGDQGGVKNYSPPETNTSQRALAEVLLVLKQHEQKIQLNRKDLKLLRSAVPILSQAVEHGNLQNPEVRNAAGVVWHLTGGLLTGVVAGSMLEAFKAIAG